MDRIWAIGLDLDDQGDLGGLAAALGAAGGELGGAGVAGAGQNGHPGGVSAWDLVREHAGEGKRGCGDPYFGAKLRRWSSSSGKRQTAARCEAPELDKSFKSGGLR